MKQKEYFGVGSISKLVKILEIEKAKRIFLVTGRDSYISSGAEEAINELLQGIEVKRFFDFETNPKLEDIERGIVEFRKFDPDVVVAVGGGSVMDVAKALSFLGVQEVEPSKLIFGLVDSTSLDQERKIPLIAIPTTAGSGSEATHFAVVYAGNEKHSLAHEWVLPDYAIVDPNLTLNLPARITAVTGMDALCQAIEAYWSVNSTDESKMYSEEAIKLILESLLPAVNNPTLIHRNSMSKAANLAGKAINIAKTTACHAVAYPMTSYFGIDHGHAVGLTLGSMLEYNSRVSEDDLQDSRGVKYVQETIKKISRLLGVSDAEEGKSRIEKLMKDIGLETRLSELGLRKKDLQVIVEHGFNPGRVKNNPRVLTKEELERMLTAIV